MTNLEAISSHNIQIVVLKYHFLLSETRATWKMANSRVGAKNVLDEPVITIRLMSKDSEANLRRFLLAKNTTI